MWFNFIEVINLSFAENLKKLRKEKNLTQENLASEILVSRTLITKYESGAVFPTEENLKLLADYFAVTCDELISEEDRVSLTLKTANSLKSIKLTLNLIALSILFTFLLLLVLPVLSYGHFIDGNGSQFIYGTVSPLSAYSRYKNPLGIITFVLCLMSSGVITYLFFADKFRHAKIFKIIGAALFCACVILFIVTMVYGAKIVAMDTFSMNYYFR